MLITDGVAIMAGYRFNEVFIITISLFVFSVHWECLHAQLFPTERRTNTQPVEKVLKIEL